MATYESKKYAIIPIAATQVADGTVSDAEYQFINSLSSNAQTQINTKLASAGGSMTGALSFGDNIKATFGGAADLEIFHDSNDSIIADTGTGALEIRSSILNMRNAADTQDMFKATEGAAVELYHNNVKKAETTSSGFTVTGNILGDPISGQTSSGSASGSDEILAKIGGNMRRITIANAGLAGPPGPSSLPHMSSNFDNTTRDLVTVGPGGWPGSGTAPASATGATQTGAALTIDVTNLSKVQLTFGMKYWQSTAKTDQQYVTGFSTAQMRLLRGSTGLTDYSPGADEAYMIDEYSQYYSQNYKRRPRDITQAIVDDVSSLTGNQTYYVQMRAIWGAAVSGYYSGGNYSTTASYSGMTTGFLDVRSYGCFLSAVGA